MENTSISTTAFSISNIETLGGRLDIKLVTNDGDEVIGHKDIIEALKGDLHAYVKPIRSILDDRLECNDDYIFDPVEFLEAIKALDNEDKVCLNIPKHSHWDEIRDFKVPEADLYLNDHIVHVIRKEKIISKRKRTAYKYWANALNAEVIYIPWQNDLGDDYTDDLVYGVIEYNVSTEEVKYFTFHNSNRNAEFVREFSADTLNSYGVDDPYFIRAFRKDLLEEMKTIHVAFRYRIYVSCMGRVDIRLTFKKGGDKAEAFKPTIEACIIDGTAYVSNDICEYASVTSGFYEGSLEEFLYLTPEWYVSQDERYQKWYLSDKEVCNRRNDLKEALKKMNPTGRYIPQSSRAFSLRDEYYQTGLMKQHTLTLPSGREVCISNPFADRRAYLSYWFGNLDSDRRKKFTEKIMSGEMDYSIGYYCPSLFDYLDWLEYIGSSKLERLKTGLKERVYRRYNTPGEPHYYAWYVDRYGTKHHIKNGLYVDEMVSVRYKSGYHNHCYSPKLFVLRNRNSKALSARVIEDGDSRTVVTGINCINFLEEEAIKVAYVPSDIWKATKDPSCKDWKWSWKELLETYCTESDFDLEKTWESARAEIASQHNQKFFNANGEDPLYKFEGYPTSSTENYLVITDKIIKKFSSALGYCRQAYATCKLACIINPIVDNTEYFVISKSRFDDESFWKGYFSYVQESIKWLKEHNIW